MTRRDRALALPRAAELRTRVGLSIAAERAWLRQLSQAELPIWPRVLLLFVVGCAAIVGTGALMPPAPRAIGVSIVVVPAGPDDAPAASETPWRSPGLRGRGL